MSAQDIDSMESGLEKARDLARAPAVKAAPVPSEVRHYLVLVRNSTTQMWTCSQIPMREDEAIAACVSERLNGINDAVRYVPLDLPIGKMGDGS